MRVRVTDHLGKVSIFEVAAGGRLRIGRSDENEVTLTDPSLSRRHAEIYHENGAWMLKDSGSRNGTLVGGRAIGGPVPFAVGMQVSVGACAVTLEGDEPQQSTAQAVTFADRPLETHGTMVFSPDDLLPAPAPAMRDGASFARELENIRKRLAIVERANLELLAHEKTEVLLPKVLDLVFEAVRPERAALVQRRPDGELVCSAYRGETREQMSISRTIANTVIDQRVSVLTSDAQADERFASGASILAQGIQAVMAVPLWNNKRVIGLIYADSRLTSAQFGDEDLKLLTMLANLAAIQIENAALFAEQLEKQRFEREAEAAADIQRRLLPRSRPELPGYVFEGHNEPCHECGGDYYDCLQLGSERTGIVLSDVAGKGMGAAMLMAVIQATLQARADSGAEPGELVAALAKAISRSAPSNRYATLFFMDLNHATHLLRYVNAGHAPLPLLVRASGEVRELETGGPPLGLFPTTYPVAELVMSPGDLVFASSDGVTDLENPEEETFGEERLKQLLTGFAGRPPADVRAALDRELVAFAGEARRPDDLTYIILQREA